MPLLFIGACRSDLDLPSDQSWTSAHFRYHTRSTNHSGVCPDILSTLEEYADRIHGAVGLSWDPGEVVDYYEFDDATDFAAHAGCEDLSDGCSSGNSVRTFIPFHEHELVHALFNKLGRPPPLLEEGAAVALSCGLYDLWPLSSTPSTNWRDAFAAPYTAPDRALYVTGGWLASHLLATRDPALLVGLYRRVSAGSSADSFAATFANVFGTSLDDVWSEAASAPGGTLFCPWECSPSELSLDGTPVALGNTCGLSSDQHPFSLNRAGDTVWSVAGSTQMDIRDCDHLRPLEQPLVAFGSTPTLGAIVSLDPGRYYVDRQIRPDGGVTVSASIADPTLITEGACANAVSTSLTSETGFFYVRFKSAAVPQLVHIAAPSPRPMTAGGSDPTAGVTLCPGCGANPTLCVQTSPTNDGEPLTPISIGTDTVVSVGAGNAVVVSFWPPPESR